jgi:hypothetical protein
MHRFGTIDARMTRGEPANGVSMAPESTARKPLKMVRWPALFNPTWIYKGTESSHD